MSASIVGMPGAQPPPAEPLSPVVALQGWASDYSGDDPAVMLNPNASPRARAAWALGQLSQVNALLRIMCIPSINDGCDPAELAGAILHFSEQAELVLKKLPAMVTGPIEPAD